MELEILECRAIFLFQNHKWCFVFCLKLIETFYVVFMFKWFFLGKISEFLRQLYFCTTTQQTVFQKPDILRIWLQFNNQIGKFWGRAKAVLGIYFVADVQFFAQLFIKKRYLATNEFDVTSKISIKSTSLSQSLNQSLEIYCHNSKQEWTQTLMLVLLRNT